MPSAEEIEQARTPKGGWTKAQLEKWGVPWPPPEGWKDELVRESQLYPWPWDEQLFPTDRPGQDQVLWELLTSDYPLRARALLALRSRLGLTDAEMQTRIKDVHDARMKQLRRAPGDEG